MNSKDQLYCLWSAPVVGGLFLVAFSFFPGFAPVVSPTWSAQQVSLYYQNNIASIRGSMILCNVIGISIVPLFMVIVTQMLRIVNSSRALAYSYMGAAIAGATMFALADLGWLIAAYRPERDPQLLMLLNDFAWLCFISPVGFIICQNLCLAIAIFLDKSVKPVYPRWVAYFNLVAAVLMAPGAFAIMYKTGPFAWDGALAFYLRLGTYGVYILVMFLVTLNIVKGQLTTYDSEPSEGEVLYE